MGFRPSYEIATERIAALFAALGLCAVFSAPRPKVEKGNGEPWPCTVFDVTFSRASGGRPFSQEWRAWTGLAPWKHRTVVDNARRDIVSAFSGAAKYVAERECLGRGPHRSYSPDIEAEAAAIAWQVSKTYPDASEIFASCCRDGFEARDINFESWAAMFGYDADSRKAKKVFNTCRDLWAKVCALIPSTEAEKFARLSQEL